MIELSTLSKSITSVEILSCIENKSKHNIYIRICMKNNDVIYKELLFGNNNIHSNSERGKEFEEAYKLIKRY